MSGCGNQCDNVAVIPAISRSWMTPIAATLLTMAGGGLPGRREARWRPWYLS